MTNHSHKRDRGLTLVEVVIVLVLLGILSAYAVMRNGSASNFTLLSQAQTMASDIRHAQTLAASWGRSLRISTVVGTNGSYSVSCVSSGTFPCNSSPVVNPATGMSFTVTMQQNVALTGTTTLDIDSLGKPNGAAAYALTSGANVVNVSVAALTGFVTVAPP